MDIRSTFIGGEVETQHPTLRAWQVRLRRGQRIPPALDNSTNVGTQYTELWNSSPKLPDLLTRNLSTIEGHYGTSEDP